jgi:hypothetical protein
LQGKYICNFYEFEAVGGLAQPATARKMLGQTIHITDNIFLWNGQPCAIIENKNIHKVPISDVIWTKSQILGQDTIPADLYSHALPDSVLLLPFQLENNENTDFFVLNNNIVLKKAIGNDRYCYFFFSPQVKIENSK